MEALEAPGGLRPLKSGGSLDGLEFWKPFKPPRGPWRPLGPLETRLRRAYRKVLALDFSLEASGALLEGTGALGGPWRFALRSVGHHFPVQ